jgi:dipeptidyl aminopeptidase/acylaminoacyl peptidase
MPVIAEYGTWRSPITAVRVTAAQVGLAQPSLDHGIAYWLESRPEEGGRNVLVRKMGGSLQQDLSPPPFNVRTRVHEYGGGAYGVRDGVVVLANDADQRVYRLDAAGGPCPLTPESGGRLRYADFELDLGHNRVLAVREDHRSGGEPVNAIVAIDLEGAADEGRLLAGGHDFVSSPRLSPDGRSIAWLTWDHPDMPWDATSLWRAGIGTDGDLREVRRVAGGGREAIVQPHWGPDGALYFVSDRSGFWNIYRAEGDANAPVRPMSAEFAGPAWAFGMRWYGCLRPGSLLACFAERGCWQLGRIEVAGGRLERLDLSFTELSGLAIEEGRAILRAGAPDRPAAIITLDPATGRYDILREAGDLDFDSGFIARPEPIEFESANGRSAYAFHYPPTNADHAGPAASRPPLLVKSHGGPTGAASSELRLSTQFWTSRGFALCDVNYGGSSGFGRAYRELLLGRWGEVDVEDCVSAAKRLSADGKADENRLIITGGSAGGYTTLCALTFHDVFKAGASHYGVSDLEALARDTHKFESRYLDRLVGLYPDAAELYRARSPIHHVDRLSCPIIFFQGLEDAIVPPNQAEAMVEALRRKGIPVAYLVFEGEQHGFRKAQTIQTVLKAELAFYGRVFGFEPADGWSELVIENADPPSRYP